MPYKEREIIKKYFTIGEVAKNLKKPDDLLYKYKNLCETNDPIHFKEKIDEKFLDSELIKEKIINGKDLLGRDDQFQKVEIDNTFPDYLRENKFTLKDWIK